MNRYHVSSVFKSVPGKCLRCGRPVKVRRLRLTTGVTRTWYCNRHLCVGRLAPEYPEYPTPGIPTEGGVS